MCGRVCVWGGRSGSTVDVCVEGEAGTVRRGQGRGAVERREEGRGGVEVKAFCLHAKRAARQSGDRGTLIKINGQFFINALSCTLTKTRKETDK